MTPASGSFRYPQYGSASACRSRVSCLRADTLFHDIRAGIDLPTEPFAISNLVPAKDGRA